MTPYSVVVLSYHRPVGLLRVVEGAWRQIPPPAEIVVWHNGTMPDVPGCVNLRSPHNYGSIARYVAAQLCTAPVVVFIDDDLELRSETVCARLLASVGRHPDVPNGWIGRNLAAGEHPYSAGMDVSGDRKCDVVKGLIHAVRRRLVVESLRHDLSAERLWGSDDIALSASVTILTGQRPRLVPLVGKDSNQDVVCVPESTGFEDRADHWQSRDAACMAWMAKGWSPKLTP